jgi:hypothetical protein
LELRWDPKQCRWASGELVSVDRVKVNDMTVCCVSDTKYKYHVWADAEFLSVTAGGARIASAFKG